MPGEHIVDADKAKRLLAAQFPALAAYPVTPSESTGTDNQIFRLGDRLCLRFPKAPWASQSAEREVSILSRLSGLPLDVPEVFGLGVPGEDYPWQWSVMSWIEGEVVGTGTPENTGESAKTLADFIIALRRTPADPAFAYDARNNYRGCDLRERDAAFRRALPGLADLFDTEKMLRIWEDYCVAAKRAAQYVWLHGDLHGGNLLMREGKLAGVIDWGLAGVGDGACDLAPGWVLFERAERDQFFARLGIDEAEYYRGAGWALSIAAIFVAHYRTQNVATDMSERTIHRVLKAFA